MEVCWDDIGNPGYNGNNITSNSYVPYIKNIKSEYRTSEIANFKLACRPEFPTKTYTTSSFYLGDNVDMLPGSSSYSIYDSVTNDVIIQNEDNWANSTTKIDNNTGVSNFSLRMDSFMPERYYRIRLKCIRSNDTQTFDDFYFKVVR